MALSEAEFAAIEARTADENRFRPRAVAATWLPERHRVLIEMDNGLEVTFAPERYQDLANARSEQLAEIEVSGRGSAIYFPRLDASLYIPGMLQGLTGTRQWMAQELGRRGGKATSVAKAAASAANGKLGGRPRKAAAS
jgi:hypothetical protein